MTYVRYAKKGKNNRIAKTTTSTNKKNTTANHDKIPVKEFSSDIGEVGSAKKSKRLKNANPACELRDYCRQKAKGET